MGQVVVRWAGGGQVVRWSWHLRKAACVGEWVIHRTGPLCPRESSCLREAFLGVGGLITTTSNTYLLSHTQREVVASSGNIT